MADEYPTSIYSALDILRKKWTLHVLNNIFVGYRRYTEILNNTIGLTDKILSQRLRELQDNGLLLKILIDGEINKFEYVLTDIGKSLNKFFFELAIFSALNYPDKIFGNNNPILSKSFPLLGKLYMMSKEGTHQSMISHGSSYIHSKQKLIIMKNPVIHTLEILCSHVMFLIIFEIGRGINNKDDMLSINLDLTIRTFDQIIAELKKVKIITQNEFTNRNLDESYLLTMRGNEIYHVITQLEHFSGNIIDNTVKPRII